MELKVTKTGGYAAVFSILHCPNKESTITPIVYGPYGNAGFISSTIPQRRTSPASTPANPNTENRTPYKQRVYKPRPNLERQHKPRQQILNRIHMCMCVYTQLYSQHMCMYLCLYMCTHMYICHARACRCICMYIPLSSL